MFTHRGAVPKGLTPFLCPFFRVYVCTCGATRCTMSSRNTRTASWRLGFAGGRCHNHLRAAHHHHRRLLHNNAAITPHHHHHT